MIEKSKSRRLSGAVTAALMIAAASCGSTAGAGSDLVTPNGGHVDSLRFTVFGDCRPPNVDDTANYPTAVITSIFEGMQQLDTDFAIGTGDYMFADNAADVTAQLTDLKSAMRHFSRPVFPAMGNHECTGATASNCPFASETPNVQHYMADLVPFSKVPWYDFTLDTPRGAAKFVFVAANAWSPSQQSWLQGTLAQKTTYTFVIRHEPPGTTAPGGDPSQALISGYPVTLEIFGHSHEYSHYSYGGSYNQVISGNGGAPMSSWSGSNYGYLYVVQRPDGNVSVTEYQQGTNTATDSWAVTPSGQQTN